jgi:NADPH:quinone reductase-like Zn-dependent oxidoreductase
MVAMGQIPDSKIGLEGAGVIHRLGPGVTRFKLGDRVAFFTHGAHRTLLRTLADNCELIPEGMSFEDAATIPTVHGTAWYGIVQFSSTPLQAVLAKRLFNLQST